MSSNIYKGLGLTTAILGAGYGVATFGRHNSVGDQIPDARSELRTQGAQGEAVKAGKKVEEAQKEIPKVQVKGGDTGRMTDKPEEKEEAPTAVK